VKKHKNKKNKKNTF